MVSRVKLNNQAAFQGKGNERVVVTAGIRKENSDGRSLTRLRETAKVDVLNASFVGTCHPPWSLMLR